MNRIHRVLHAVLAERLVLNIRGAGTPQNASMPTFPRQTPRPGNANIEVNVLKKGRYSGPDRHPPNSWTLDTILTQPIREI